MGRRWYAIEHRYGANVCDNDGDHIGEVYAFLTKAERDRWVANSLAEYTNRPGYREPLRMDNATDRTAIRRWQREMAAI